MGSGKNSPGGGRTKDQIDQSSRGTNSRDPEGKANLDNHSVQVGRNSEAGEKGADGK